MTDHRIRSHPILQDLPEPSVNFFWKKHSYLARPGEMISSALIAQGFTIFGHHSKDGSPQGIFCANGQCSQCMVIADGIPVKACMTAVQAGMRIEPKDADPVLPEVDLVGVLSPSPIPVVDVEVLIIGAGPAGLSSATELGELGVKVLMIDDKNELGGKLVLQTHRFFGSSEAVYAGTRGIDIAKKLAEKVHSLPTVEIWTNSTAVGIFEEKTVGVFKDNHTYCLVKPHILLVATGAREKSLAFHGNTLPGIYGAGAFQTLVNRDLVEPCKNLFIIGGGNVGLIAGYHAIQAGIHVAGLVEAAPSCGGYKVHLDKLVRSGVPVYTSHTVLEALGDKAVEKVVVAEVDSRFKPIKGTEQVFECDTVLIAVGLDPVSEFIDKAIEVGLPVFSAGDAHEIAEASAAIFSGKIVGNEIAQALGRFTNDTPKEWIAFEEVLKSKPGRIHESELPENYSGVYPVLHCSQEIPCDPCSGVCPKHLIMVDKDDIRAVPEFIAGEGQKCIACARCVAVCPGLAITLVDFRKQNGFGLVSLPYEQDPSKLQVGQMIGVTTTTGEKLGQLPIQKIGKVPGYKGTTIVTVEAPQEMAGLIAGLTVIEQPDRLAFEQVEDFPELLADDAYICRCERVTAGEIRALIRAGIKDINQIKAVTKASMGACRGKTCLNMIKGMYLTEGIPLSEVTETPIRPVFVEIPIGVLANIHNRSEGGVA
ncbi:MAG: FAD-dependent oxidoreductase [Anaerolineaceae bacterium]